MLRSYWARVLSAMEDPYETFKSEDYYVIQLHPPKMPAAELLASHGAEIAQIVRGESQPLSDAEQRELLQSSMSYYPTDLMVVGWVGALVCDTPEGAATTIQLLEYANTQLLEFRHYDEVLTKVLQTVYKKLDQRGGLLRRWRMAREAERLNRIRLDVIELTERTETAIKFLSDMFYARAYRGRLAAWVSPTTGTWWKKSCERRASYMTLWSTNSTRPGLLCSKSWWSRFW